MNKLNIASKKKEGKYVRIFMRMSTPAAYIYRDCVIRYPAAQRCPERDVMPMLWR